jgi:flagellar basal-body rod protein FlgG
MYRALSIAASGMRANQLQIDVTANNLANVSTTGFRRSRADFADLLYQNLRQPGAPNAQGGQAPAGIQVGSGVRPVATVRMLAGGETHETGNELDLAVEGDGYFAVSRPNGELGYTRAGNFQLDRDGQVVTHDGYPLEPAISIPPDAQSLTISEDGTVSVLQAGDTEPVEVGRLELVMFPNEAGLESVGNNLFRQTAASGEPMSGPPGEEGRGTLRQGYLESSNVQVVTEMIDLISSQRAYEVNSKVVSAADEMMRSVTNMR